MAYRIFTSGNYFYIVDGNGREKDGLARDVIVTRAASTSTEFRIRNVNNWNHTQFLDITEILKEDGSAYTLNEFIDFYEGSTGTNSKSYISVAKNDLGYDAWGRLKTVSDKSLFSGLFTFNVPVSKWKEVINGTEQTSFTYATSVDGKLNLVSNGTLDDEVVLDSYQNPRYEANRGHLYSTAGYLPSPTAEGIREWGLFTSEAGCFFRLTSTGLYAVIRTTVTGTGVIENAQLIDITDLDLSKGNTYDIQFQWRGVGNYVFLINLKEVYTFKNLGKTTYLSIWNPALPIAFKCINKGADVTINIGCVDVTTEGGNGNGTTYGSVAVPTVTNDVALTGFNCPCLVVHNKSTLADGRRNTRDITALLLTAWSDSKGVIKVWYTRDTTAITLNDQSFTDYGDGHLEYIWYDNPNVTTPISFDTAKATQSFGARLQADVTYETDPVFGEETEIGIYPGDYLIFTIHKDNGGPCNGGVCFEFAEKI